LPELEKTFMTGDRPVNEREIADGLTGKKCGFVDMAQVNETNFHNLLSEFHLRPFIIPTIPEADFDKKMSDIKEEIGKLVTENIAKPQ
jgi:hypothetical protein